MRIWAVVLLVIAMLPAGLSAQTAADTAARAVSPEVAAATRALPGATVKRLRTASDRFAQEAGRLIYGYGENGSIDASDLARFITLSRASTRARSLRSFLDADLDNNGVVDGDEVVSRADSLAANARGQLRLNHVLADMNRDGSVSGDEMRAFAQLDAMDAMTVEDASVIMGFIGFDTNKDGGVTMLEVQAMIAVFRPDP